MSGEFSRAAAFKNAMIAAAHTLWDVAEPAVDIVNGHPGVTQVDDIVSFGEITSAQEPGALSASRRTRIETLTLTVVFSIYRAGGRDQEQATFDRGMKLLGDLERYVRVTDTNVGGTVEWCFLVGHASDGATDPSVISKGRLTTIAAQFEARARITTSS